MWIDPILKHYDGTTTSATHLDNFEGEITSAEEEYDKFHQAMKEGKVVAQSNDKEQLRRLQDDLRKAGYKKMR